MKKRLFALAAGFFLIAGCAQTGQFAAAGSTSPGRAPAPAPAEKPGKDEFVAALEKTGKTAYKFAVSAAAPEKQRIQATGSFDPRSKKLSNTIKVTGGKDPQSRQRIVIAGDLYEKKPGERTWVHLDLKRVKKDSYLQVNMADPNGLGAFTKAIESAQQTGPRGWSGAFDPSSADEFLPIGAPSIWILGGTATFTALTDAQGWITKITVQVRNKETLNMTTTFSAHGKPVAITKPKRVGEAMDIYYD
ncbi:hypothetical protein AB0J83_15605 [Actinoplanes sp. NPDC049596]|uniref:hypothetical protein n=1 Tax=unclassified Actinoplanes TaxID=2626549 RepID=UPI00342C8875